MTNKIVHLPQDFIGKEDEVRLASFGAHLIEHGVATRWQWRRSSGIDIAFLIYRGGPNEQLLASIGRDSRRDIFFADDERGIRLTEGSLEKVMAAVDSLARMCGPDSPA